MKTPVSATDNNVGRKVPENVPETNVGKINGRTPDEIKKGLEKCFTGGSVCDGCEFSNGNAEKWRNLMGLALAYIQQLETDNESKQKRIDKLESRLAQAVRERDAAVHDIAHDCTTCKHFGEHCFNCEWGEYWEWRGVCPENTKGEEK